MGILYRRRIPSRISFGNIDKLQSSLFTKHLIREIRDSANTILLTEKGLEGCNQLVARSLLESRQNIQDQNDVIEQIKKVASGHRKRPLVLTADRGRGKTAALGIILAQLVQETPRNILVTAPQKARLRRYFARWTYCQMQVTISALRPSMILH